MFQATMCPSPRELTVSMRHRYFSLCMGGCLVCWLGWDWVSSQPADRTATQSHPNQQTRQPLSLIPTSRPDSHSVSSQPADQTATHTEWKIPVYSEFSWWWAHSCPKHVEKLKYRRDDKSLARPGRKKANVSVTMEWIYFDALLCRTKTWWQLASRCCWNRARPWHASELVSFLVGLKTYQHPVKYTKN